VADGVAPLAEAGRTAHGADFDGVSGAGRQAVDRNGAGVGADAAALPLAEHVAGAEDGKPGFIGAGIGNGLDPGQQLTGRAVGEVDDGGRLQGLLGVGGAGGLETGGVQRRQIIVALGLDVEGQLAQGSHQHGPGIVLGRGGGGTALFHVSQRITKRLPLRLHIRQRNRRCRNGGVTGHVGEHGFRELIQRGIRGAGKIEPHPELLIHFRTS